VPQWQNILDRSSGRYTGALAAPASRRIAAPTAAAEPPQCWHSWTMRKTRQRRSAMPPPTGRRRFAAPPSGRRQNSSPKARVDPRACELNRKRDALRDADADEKDMRRQTEAEVAGCASGPASG